MSPDTAILESLVRPDTWQRIGPSIFLTLWGLVVLLADVGWMKHWPADRRRAVLGKLTLGGIVFGIFLAMLLLMPSPSPFDFSLGGRQFQLGVDTANNSAVIFGGTLNSDASTAWMNLVVLALATLVTGVAMTWNFTDYWGEFFALLLWAAVGMMMLIASAELLTLFLTLETMTICLYLLTSLEKNRERSAEAGLKYFIYGSVSSALFLFGLSLIYGLTGSTRLTAIHDALNAQTGQGLPVGLAGNVAGALAVLLVLVGFGFKIAAVPFHQWAPDAYEGAPAPAAAWLASGSKVASVIALVKVMVYGLGAWSTNRADLSTPGWVGLLALVSAVTMTYGNFAALGQRNFKRMLAYSSIAHAGYILVGVLAIAVSADGDTGASAAVLFYLVVYSFATVGAFAVAAWLAHDTGSDNIDDLAGLGSRAPFMAVCVLVLMLSLIGLPPFAGFFGKLYMFMEALNTREEGLGVAGEGRLTLTWLVGLGLLNSVVSAFYYVRVLKAMFLRPAQSHMGRSLPSGVFWPVLASTAITVLFGIWPSLLVAPMKGAAVVPMLSAAPVQRAKFSTEAVDPERARQINAERAKREKENEKRLFKGSP